MGYWGYLGLGLLTLYLLYCCKSALGINLSRRYHAGDFLKLPLRALRYPETRRSLRRYLQLNRHNPLPGLVRWKMRQVRSRLGRIALAIRLKLR